MWWLAIVADCIVAGLAVLICYAYYGRTYGTPEGGELLKTLRQYESTHGRVYKVYAHFRNYWSNIVVKAVFTVACVLLIRFTDTMWITIIYVALVAFSLYTYVGRCVHYKKLTAEERVPARAAQRLAVIIPVCHLIFCGSLYLTYVLMHWHPAA